MVSTENLCYIAAMRRLLRIAALLLATLLLVAKTNSSAASASGTEGEAPVTPVDHVDLERYAGLWHEIARIPNRFQKQCASGTTAEYTLRDDGRITVVNRCTKADGSQDEAKGVAKVADAGSGARLRVSFVSFLGWRPFWGDYWILGLDPEYRWAIVGTPDRTYGWVLARTPALDGETLDHIFAILERNGYTRTSFEMRSP